MNRQRKSQLYQVLCVDGGCTNDASLAIPQEVSTRACYLFSRLAKLLRQTLAPFLPDILASLQPLLATIAGDPLPPSANGASALARSTSGKGSAAFPGAADDRSVLCSRCACPHSVWHLM